MQLDEMSQYAEMEDLLIYIFLEIPVKIENAWNVKFILCLLDISKYSTCTFNEKCEIHTADGAIVIGIVMGSGDLISRLEELLLPPLL